MIPFIKLKFEGARFPPKRMPVECLPELAAYRELVLAFARALYVGQNPGRQRLPKGFDSGFQLVLDRIDEGSAVPVIQREPPAQLPFGPDLFEQARDLITETIRSASTGAGVPDGVTSELIARFATLGRTLEKGDRLFFLSDGAAAEYSRDVRQTLVRLARVEYEDDVDLVGEIRAADRDQDGFTIRLGNGRRVRARASGTVLPTVLRALEAGVPVRLRGVGQFDAEGALQRVVQVTDVGPGEEGDAVPTRVGCSIPIETQVASLAALPAGWMNGDGEAFDAEGTRRIGQTLEAIVSTFALPNPYVYPTIDGEVRAEWSRPGWEIAANFSPSSGEVDVIAVNLREDAVIENHAALTQPGGELHVGRLLRERLEERSS